MDDFEVALNSVIDEDLRVAALELGSSEAGALSEEVIIGDTGSAEGANDMARWAAPATRLAARPPSRDVSPKTPNATERRALAEEEQLLSTVKRAHLELSSEHQYVPPGAVRDESPTRQTRYRRSDRLAQGARVRRDACLVLESSLRSWTCTSPECVVDFLFDPPPLPSDCEGGDADRDAKEHGWSSRLRTRRPRNMSDRESRTAPPKQRRKALSPKHPLLRRPRAASPAMLGNSSMKRRCTSHPSRNSRQRASGIGFQSTRNTHRGNAVVSVEIGRKSRGLGRGRGGTTTSG